MTTSAIAMHEAAAFPQTTAFVSEIQAEFPKFRIVPKRGSALSHLIDGALRLVTLGAQRHYLTRYHTVIGDTLYVCDGWAAMSDVSRVILLRHERVHLRQRRRYGLVPFAILYLLPILPLGLAYFRARFEWEAYSETLRATAELRGLDALRDAALRREIVRRFVSADYGWMWPFSRTIERWYDQEVLVISDELGARNEPLAASPNVRRSADGSSRAPGR